MDPTRTACTGGEPRSTFSSFRLRYASRSRIYEAFWFCEDPRPFSHHYHRQRQVFGKSPLCLKYHQLELLKVCRAARLLPLEEAFPIKLKNRFSPPILQLRLVQFNTMSMTFDDFADKLDKIVFNFRKRTGRDMETISELKAELDRNLVNLKGKSGALKSLKGIL
jgi:hypothetical protein